jgi:predicted transposase/invertase (TIGR01784 family)
VNQNVIETARLDGIAEGIEQGLEKGKLEEKFAIAKGMLAEGLSIEIIAKLTSLTHDEIQSLI